MSPLYFKNNPEKRRLRVRRRPKRVKPQISREKLNEAIDRYLKAGGKITKFDKHDKKESDAKAFSKQSVRPNLSGKVY